MVKYLVVTGGVVSGLGKGISISSLGVLLSASGVKVNAIKVDPYLNVDSGTLSPYEHGEVYVLDDGGECDLDLGNYERFLDLSLTSLNQITTGKVYSRVLAAERRGDYLGKTVQVIPHVTDEIIRMVESAAQAPIRPSTTVYSEAGKTSSAALPEPADVCLIEVGGTVGDMESAVFLEALRQLQNRVGRENLLFVHVALVPIVGGEQKTKPAQHSVKELRSAGISPDFLLCRSATALEPGTKAKLALHCQVAEDHLLAVQDVPNIYHVPLLLDQQRAAHLVAKRLGITLPFGEPRLALWRGVATTVDDKSLPVVKVALVGKYTTMSDSYLSVLKSLQHAAIYAKRRLELTWVDAASLEPSAEASEPDTYRDNWDAVRTCDGILVPGGFGERGVEGKILAIKYARENKKPFLGICLGLQAATIEFSRNVLGLQGAHSAEFNPEAPHKVVIFMPEVSTTNLGGTMRLGARATLLANHHARLPASSYTLAAEVYGRESKMVWERHRHRYEVNPDYVPALESKGLLFTGKDDRNQRMEVLELDRAEHPFFFALQAHPEFQSHPHRPSPPFLGFILASAGDLEANLPLTSMAAARKAAESAESAVLPAEGSASSSATSSSSSSSTVAVSVPSTPPRPSIKTVPSSPVMLPAGGKLARSESMSSSGSHGELGGKLAAAVTVAAIETSPMRKPGAAAADAAANGASDGGSNASRK